MIGHTEVISYRINKQSDGIQLLQTVLSAPWQVEESCPWHVAARVRRRAIQARHSVPGLLPRDTNQPCMTVSDCARPTTRRQANRNVRRLEFDFRSTLADSARAVDIV